MGANKKGQLGDGTKEDKLLPAQIMSGKYFTFACAAPLTTSVNKSYAIDTQGKLWTWGLDDVVLNSTYYPQEVKSDVRFTQVAEGLAIDENGDVQTWGDNVCGEVGNGIANNILSPTPIFEEMSFVKLSSTGWSTCAIDTDGKLWGWGMNNCGQVGDGTAEMRAEPVPVMRDKKFVQVSAGYTFSHAIDEQGNLWAWGTNLNAPTLGLGEKIKKQYTPAIVKRGTKFAWVSANADCVMAIDREGNLWGWGGTIAPDLWELSLRISSTSPRNFKRELLFCLCRLTVAEI